MDEADLENMTPEQIAQLQRENCIFCKIISGEIPSKKVYEDSDFLGILDINPAADGHVLLLPKQHYQIMPQMPPEIVGLMGIACTTVSSKIIKGFKCNGTSIFIANGAVAGQRAPHFIVHIIPRTDGDNISLNPDHAEIDDKSFNAIRNAMISQLGGKSNSQTSSPQQSKPSSKQHQLEKEAEYAELDNEKDVDDEPEPQNDDFSDEEKEPETLKKKSTSKSTPKKSSSNNKIDYDKLGRLFG